LARYMPSSTAGSAGRHSCPHVLYFQIPRWTTLPGSSNKTSVRHLDRLAQTVEIYRCIKGRGSHFSLSGPVPCVRPLFGWDGIGSIPFSHHHSTLSPSQHDQRVNSHCAASSSLDNSGDSSWRLQSKRTPSTYPPAYLCFPYLQSGLLPLQYASKGPQSHTTLSHTDDGFNL
jgi:hypothetical protein